MAARLHAHNLTHPGHRPQHDAQDSLARTAIAQLRRTLKERDLRCTSQRVAIVTLLAEQDEQDEQSHLTAGEIHAHLRQRGHALNASTVYRSLTTLVEIGILHHLRNRDHTTTYGMATTPHHHAVCTRCGHLRELPVSPLQTALDQAETVSNYDLNHDGLLLHGICPNCKEPAHPTSGPLTAGSGLPT